MTNLNFHRLSAADRDLYEKYYALSGTELTDLTFSCRISWDPVFRTEVAFYSDTCLMISDGGGYTDPHLLMPLGDYDSNKLDAILLLVEEVFRSRGWKLKIMCIDESKTDIFRSLKHFTCDLAFSEDASDYVYDAESLRLLVGNQLHKKRNHVNKFVRTYPNSEYKSLTGADKEECLRLVRRWCETKGIDPDDKNESDYRMIDALFEMYDQLDLRGGMIRIDNEVRAFSVGHLGNYKTAFIHFEKADPAYDGIYSAINQFVLKSEFPEALLVNREEDLGIPGLRKAKQSYFPLFLRKKFKTWPQHKYE